MSGQAVAKSLADRVSQPDSLSFRDSLAYLKQLGFITGEFPASTSEEHSRHPKRIWNVAMSFTEQIDKVVVERYVPDFRKREARREIFELVGIFHDQLRSFGFKD